MSSSESLAGLISALNIDRVEVNLDVAVFAVIIYDWILTLPDEIRLMWSRPMTSGKVLFFLNRYVFLAYYVAEITSDFAPAVSSTSCSTIVPTVFFFIILHNFVVSAFQVLRVYAISLRMWIFALIVGVLNVVPLFVNAYLWSKSTNGLAPPPFEGCESSVSVSENLGNTLLLIQRVSLIVADAIMLIVTVYHTYGTVRASRQANIPATFSSTLLYAGILYFGAMFVVNLIDIILYYQTGNEYTDFIVSLVDYMMISHFLLNLQDISKVTTDGSETSRSSRSEPNQVSSIRFVNSIIGNLGESLRDGSDEDDEDDVDIPSDLEVGTPLDDSDRKAVHASSILDKGLEENVAGPSRLTTPNTSRHGASDSEMPL